MLGTDSSVILGHSISSSQAENIMSKPKKVTKQLTIVKKVELIKSSENRSVRQLAKEFGEGTVSNVLKRKREIVEQYEENVDDERCRKMKKTNHEELNNLMWDFFQACRHKNIPLSGPMLQEQALVYAADLNDKDFKASNG